ADNSARLSLEARGIEDNVLDAFALPGVRHVDPAIAGLDHGGIRVLAGRVLERDRTSPHLAVSGDRDIELGASGGGGVVDQKQTAVGEAHSIDAGAWIGQRRALHGSPGAPFILRPRLRDHALTRAT